MKHKLRWRNELSNWIFLLPVLSLYIVSVVYPFLSGLHISLTDWNGVSRELNYVGLKNYINIFSNDGIVQPLKNTLYYAVICTIGENVIALAAALAINRKFKGRAFVRTAFFLPTAISTILAVFIWNFIFRDVMKELFGWSSLLGNPKTVLLGIVIIHIWLNMGVSMLVYLSSLTSVPLELYEAAELDGASTIQRFFRVTLPMIVPAFTTCLTLTLTNALREFALPFAATGGGPAGASETIGIYIYNYMLTYNKAGYGQAVATIFTVVLVVLGSAMSGALRKKEVEA